MITRKDDDATDRDDYLENAPLEFLICRDIGHRWIEVDKRYWRPSPEYPWRIRLKCDRCEGTGLKIQTAAGTFARRSTLDPDYYLKGNRLPRVDVSNFRVQQAEAEENAPRPRKRGRKK